MRGLVAEHPMSDSLGSSSLQKSFSFANINNDNPSNSMTVNGMSASYDKFASASSITIVGERSRLLLQRTASNHSMKHRPGVKLASYHPLFTKINMYVSHDPSSACV